MRIVLSCVFVAGLMLTALLPIQAQEAAPVQPDAAKPAPYDKDLLRLAEILGSLHYLRPLCNQTDGQEWRVKMQALLESENQSPERRDKLAGAFNAGYHSFQRTYTRCTDSADIATRRFLTEGARLSRDITERYGH